MAIETKEEEEKNLEEELRDTALAAAAKRAGPLDRAPELFFLMAAPTVTYFVQTNNDDMLFLSVIIGVFALLALLGGAITNVGMQMTVNTAGLDPMASKGDKEDKKAAK